MNDIEGKNIEVGDLILLAKNGLLSKSYVLGETKKALIVSCKRINYKYKYIHHNNPSEIEKKQAEGEAIGAIDWTSYRNLDKHNAKQYLYYPPDILILGKNAKIPENLRKLINK